MVVESIKTKLNSLIESIPSITASSEELEDLWVLADELRSVIEFAQDEANEEEEED